MSKLAECPLCGEHTLEGSNCLNKDCRYSYQSIANSYLQTVRINLSGTINQGRVLEKQLSDHEKLVQGLSWMLCSFGRMRDRMCRAERDFTEDAFRKHITKYLTHIRLQLIEKMGCSAESEKDHVI